MDITANVLLQVVTPFVGYIAGSGDGIVTVAGKPASCHIHLLDASNFAYLCHTVSLQNGHYLFSGIDPAKQYLVIARDYNREYEPAVFDYVAPATDLTVQQQQELWESWQTK